MRRRQPPKPHVQGWVAPLVNGRLEIFLKTANLPGQPDRKIRASGSEEEMDELLDWFEQRSGMRVEVPNRKRVHRGPKPPEGQMVLTMGVGPSAELSSDATLAT